MNHVQIRLGLNLRVDWAIFCLVFFFSCATLALAAPDTLIVADDRDYPPFVFLDADGQARGVTVDIWNLWSAKTGIPVEFRLMEWDAALQAVRNGRADAVGALFRTSERENVFAFTTPYSEITTAIFFHQQITGIKDVRDLAGFNVGVVKGDSAEEWIRSSHPGITVIAYDGARELIARAVAGEVKVFVSDVPVARYYLAQHDGGEEFRQATGSVLSNPLHAGVRKDNQELLNVLQQGFDQISAAEIQSIMDQWGGKRLFADVPWRVIALGFLVLAVPLLFVLIWNMTLRRRVRAKTAELAASLNELRRSEERFAKAFHSSPAPLVISDIATGRIIDVNDRWVEMLGYSRAEQLGRTTKDIGIWADPGSRDRAIELLAAQGFFKEYSTEFLAKSGETRFVLWSAEVVNLEGREVLLSLLFDYTERKRHEEALRHSESLYRSVIDNIQDVFYRTDAAGRLIMLSPSGVDLLGYDSDEEMLGRPNDFFWFDPTARKAFLARIHAEGAVRDFEVVLKRKDGQPVLVATSSGFYRDTDGNVLGVEGIFRDITARKHAEERLRQSEEKFSRLFMISPDAISLSEPESGILVDVNDAFVRLSGFSREEALGRSTLELQLFTDPLTRKRLLDRLHSTGRASNVEMDFRCKDGSLIQGSVSCQMFTLGQKKLLLSVMRDLTEFKRMQTMMIQTEKMISVGGIAAGIAHEINNPLGIIVQTAQNLALRTRPDFRKNLEVAEKLGLDMRLLEQYMQARGIQKFVRDIQDAALRAADIIRHMMDFSRRNESRWTLCAIDALVDRALELAQNDYDLGRNYDFKSVRIVREYENDLPQVECTETEIEQVILNLLRNAAQAMGMTSPSTASPAITVRLRHMGPDVRIEVEDNGPGMSAEVVRRAFEPFFTTKPPGVGTGLGLSVSYFIVTRGHGGRMWVESEPGAGAKFVIELPVSRKDATDDGQ